VLWMGFVWFWRVSPANTLQLQMKNYLFSMVTLVGVTGSMIAQTEDLGNIINLDPVKVIAEESTHANTVLRYELQEFAAPITSALDRIDVLPGVIVQEGDAYGGDDWSTTVSIRGFQTTRDTNQLGYTIDDLPNGATNYGGGAKPNRFIDPENIREVNVSQGAGDISSASTTALGGTIKYYMSDPLAEQAFRFEMSSGDNNMHRYYARVDTGMIGENTRGFVSFSDSHHNRWTEEGENGLANRSHVDSAWKSKFGSMNLQLRFSWDDIHEDNYNGVTQEQFAEDPYWDRLTGEWTGNPIVDQMFVEGWSTVRQNLLAGLKVTMPIGDTGTLMIQPYVHSQGGEGHWIPPYQRRGFDAAGNAVSYADFAVSGYRVFYVDANGNDIPEGQSVTEGATPVSSFRTSHYSNGRLGVRVDYQQDLGDNNHIEAGFWLENQERDNWRNWHKVLDATVSMQYDRREYWTDFDNTFNTDTIMYYIQDTIELNRFSIVLGLKQFMVDLSKYDNVNKEEVATIDSESEVLPSAGIAYNLNDGRSQLFANFTRNHGAISDIYLLEDTDISRIEPEKADSIDLGYRASGENYSFSASVYQIKFDNKISNVTPQDETGGINYDIGDGGAYLNVGGIESTGFEFAGNYRISSDWSIYASATFNNSEYTTTIPSNSVVKGNEVVGAAGEIFVASLLYSSSKGIYGGLTVKYTGDRQGTLDNSEQMEAYTKADLNLGYRRDFSDKDAFVKTFKAELKVYNLFDTSYLATPDGDGYAHTGYYFIGAPRSVSATVGFEF